MSVIHTQLAKQSYFLVQQTSIDHKKIDSIGFKTFEIVMILFEVVNKRKSLSFLKKFFSFTNLSINIVFRILFLILINMKVNFLELVLL